MRKLEEINAQIELLEKKLTDVQGTKTEVYTRIVGYHRDVNNWNKGKREEYDFRVPFTVSEKVDFQPLVEDVACESSDNSNDVEEIKGEVLNTGVSKYTLFTSVYCHNCPPVKNYLEAIDLHGENIDVSTDLGLEVAKRYNVMSTPTVLFFDEKERLVNTLHSLDDIKKIL